MLAAAVEGFRLSAQQRRVWSLAEGSSEVYQAQCAVLLEGCVDQGIFERALQRVVQRHEILRTSFHYMPHRRLPVQTPCEGSAMTLRHAAKPAGADLSAAVADLLRQEREQAGDPEDGFLRARLLTVSGDLSYLVLTLSALAGDATTLELLVRELGEIYAALLSGSELPGDPVQYADFAEWQAEMLAGEDAREGLAHWRRKGFTPLGLELPFGERPPGPEAFVPASLDFDLEPLVSAGIAALGLPEPAFFLTCWSVLLGRLSGRPELAVGTLFDGRTYEELERAFGLFARQVPVACRFSAGQTFREAVAQVAAELDDARLWQDYFGWEQDAGLADGTPPPYVDAAFEYGPPEAEPIQAGPLRLSLRERFVCIDRFDLKLAVRPRAGGLIAELSYAAGLFSGAEAERLRDAFLTLLEHVLRQPCERLGDLELLGRAERAWLAESLGGQVCEVPATCLHTLVEEQAARTPHSIALLQDDLSLSYGELNRRANRLARLLRRHGISAEDRIALFLDRSCEMVVAQLAVLKAGAAFVVVQPDHPKARTAHILADASVRLVLTEDGLLGKVPDWRGETLCLDRDAHLIASEEDSNPTPMAMPEGLAYIAYTSGSTGAPKGVLSTHRGAVNYLAYLTDTYGLGAEDVALQIAAPSFDASVREIFGPLAAGGRVVIPAPETAGSPRALVEEIRAKGVTVLLSIVPTVLRQLLDAALAAPRGGGVRLVLVSGEVLYATDAIRVKQAFGEGVLLINQYGPTECTMTSSFHPVREADPGKPALPIGRPICNVRFHLLDTRLQPVPAGAAGELLIAGPGLARGYQGLPAATAERFIPDPFGAPGGRLYRTGDMARLLVGGALEFLGRRDRQVKVRGVRVELEEVEAVLAQHPEVRQAAVMLREDVPGDPRLTAYLVCSGEAPALRALRAWLGSRLPDVMVPSSFVFLDALPRTSSGKVDLAALPASARPDRGDEKAPRTPAEEILAGIWAEVLGLERVGRDEDFFDLGGHSLLATQVMARVCATFQVELPLRTLFEASTVEALAQVVAVARERAPVLRVPLLERAAAEGPAPLSFAQERLWFLDQLDPGRPTYNLPVALWLLGELDPDSLHGALREVLQRHEVLRSRFPVVAGAPVQIVGPVPTSSLAGVDLRGLEPELRQTELRHLVSLEAARPFDLEGGPLFRAFLVQVDAEEHLLFANMHHIVSDDWSMGILVREVATIYEELAGIRRAYLPELPVQYADFARWQRRWLSSDVLATQLEYWKRQLVGSLPALDLPFDRPRPAIRRYAGAREGLNLPAELSAAVQRLGRQQGSTLFMVLLAVFQTLLHRYSGQTVQSTGTAISGRGRLQTEGLIGCFADTLVLRTDLSGDPAFAELLRRVRQVCLGAYANQDLPFERLVEELNPDRSLQQTPLFQVMLVLQSRPAAETVLSDLELKPFVFQRGTAKFDLEMVALESPAGLIVQLEYDTDLFDAPTIHRALGHFQRLLEGAVEDPGRSLSALPLLAEEERHQLLVEWQRHEPAEPGGQLFHRLFELRAREHPDAVAVEEAEEGSRLTYAQLDELAGRLAGELVRCGAGPDRVVALLMERGIGFLVSVLGIFKAGAAYLPLDPKHPAPRQAQILESSGAFLLLSSRRTAGAASDALEQMPAGFAPDVLDLEEALAAAGPESGLPCRIEPGHLAYVIYTSGSTGTPKGAMVTHGGMLNHLHAKVEELGLAAQDVVAQNASQCFDISVWQLLAALLVGGRVHILGDDVAHDPARLLRAARDGGISVLEVVPSLLRFLLDEVAAQGLAGPDLPALRWLIPTGEPLPPQLCSEWWSRYPGVPLLNAYGPTECSDDVSHARLDAISLSDAVRAPIGRPVLNTRLYVLGVGARPLPVGAAGELYVGGLGVGRGYLGDPRRTAESFLPDPFAARPGARLYRTGDLARLLPDGRLDFLRRIDHQVKVRGFRIELGEIEAVLARHPGVSRAVVDLRERAAADPLLVAYVVPGPEGILSEELRGSVAAQLPDYMVPAAWVLLAELPLTANGKLDRRALPMPDLAPAGKAAGAPGALGPVEEIVAGIWSQVLGLEQVGLGESFFALGGHSLLATQVVSRLRQALGVEIPVRLLFEEPTAGALARTVRQAMAAGGGTAPRIARAERSGLLPLSYAQQRLWFIDQMNPGSTVYNIILPVRLQGDLSIRVLERTLAEILRRHEVLRTNFTTVEGEPFQVIAPAASQVIPVVDLGGLAEDLRLREAARLARGEVDRPFDLGRGPLLRVAVFRLAAQDHAVVLTMHHIVSDEWSSRLLMKEVGTLYEAYAAGRPSPLPEPQLQYADFAVWQREWLLSPDKEAQLAYWRQQLAGAPEVLDLPIARPRPPVQTFQGARQRLVLPAPLSLALRSLSREEGVTLFMLLLAAFQALLWWYTREEDIVVGTDVANRSSAETEELIGFFVNQLTLRTSLAGNLNFRELLARVRQVALGAYTHQDLPFDMVVEALRPERSLQRSPLFQVKLNMPDVPVEGGTLGGFEVSGIGLESATAKLDLMIDVLAHGEELSAVCEYNTALFEESSIRQLLERLEKLLSTVVARPDLSLAGIRELLDEQQRQEASLQEERLRELRRASMRRRSVL